MRRGIVGATAAAVLLLGGPAKAAETATVVARCEAVRVGSSIIVTGVALATGPAIDTAFSCSVYVNGNKVAEIGGVGAGPAGVLVGAISNPSPGPVHACAETPSYRQC